MTLAQLLLDHGLLQFGWFDRHGEMLPFALDLDMLASYPAVLQRVVDEAQAECAGIHATRLLCSVPALPFGVAFALHSGIPLVYSRGTSDQPVFDLVGAYDIGHPTLLLMNTIDREPTRLLAEAHRVGLEIYTILAILELRPLPASADLTVIPLLRLADVTRAALGQGQLASPHAQAVLDWIAGWESVAVSDLQPANRLDAQTQTPENTTRSQ